MEFQNPEVAYHLAREQCLPLLKWFSLYARESSGEFVKKEISQTTDSGSLGQEWDPGHAGAVDQSLHFKEVYCFYLTCPALLRNVC